MSVAAVGVAAATAVGASAATAAAVGAGAAALAGAGISAAVKSGAAKDASGAQQQAAQQSTQAVQGAADRSNQLLTTLYGVNADAQTKNTIDSQNILQPYADAGRQSLSGLQQLLYGSPAQAAVAATPDSYKYNANPTAEALAAQDAANKALQENSDKMANLPAISRQYPAMMAQLQAERDQLIKNAQRANQAAVDSKRVFIPGTPAQEARAAIDNPLGRQFNAFDYMRDPSTGGKPPPDLTKNFTAADFQSDPISGGRLPPDLMANFDEAAWLKSQGKTSQDLTKNFDVAAWLKSQGFAPNALTRNFAMSDYQADPGYQFRLDQGNRGLNNSAAAGGGLLSGATLKAIARWNSDQASQEYQNAVNRYNFNRNNLQGQEVSALGQFNNDRSNLQNQNDTAFNRFNLSRANAADIYGQSFNRFNINRANAGDVYQNAVNNWGTTNNNIFNRLSTLLGSGQNAATNQAGYKQNQTERAQQASQAYGAQVSNNNTGAGAVAGQNAIGAGDARAAGMIGQANALSSGINGAISGLNTGYNNYVQGNYLASLMKNGNQEVNYPRNGLYYG